MPSEIQEMVESWFRRSAEERRQLARGCIAQWTGLIRKREEFARGIHALAAAHDEAADVYERALAKVEKGEF